MEKLNFKQVEKFLLDCGGCGKKHLPLAEIHKGKSYCQTCKDTIAKCSVKDEFFLKKEMTYFEAQDIYIHEPKEEYIVQSCVSRKNIYRGGVAVSLDEKKQVAKKESDGRYALIEEFERNSYVKLTTGNYVKKNKVIVWGGETYMKDNIAEVLRGRDRLLNDYSHKPKPNFNSTVEKVIGEQGIPYLGFELETSIIPTSSELNAEGRLGERGLSSSDKKRKMDAAQELLQYLIDNDMHELLYFKKDTSTLNGFEIVSHPSTLSYWKNIDFRKFFEKMSEVGAAEHDSCGLHVHVSKDSLSKKQWWTLMSFVSKTANKLIKLSRRNKDKLKYCKWTSNMNSGVMAALLEGKGIFDKMPPQNSDRSAAINFNPEKSVEFRLFKSTSSAEELYATLSLVEALVMFARKYSFMYVQDSKASELWEEFTNFCKEDGYGNLMKLMDEKELVSSNVKKNKYVCV